VVGTDTQVVEVDNDQHVVVQEDDAAWVEEALHVADDNIHEYDHGKYFELVQDCVRIHRKGMLEDQGADTLVAEDVHTWVVADDSDLLVEDDSEWVDVNDHRGRAFPVPADVRIE
jgi:hypothetical protein